MKPLQLFGSVLLCAILLAPSDCVPSFNATPAGNSNYTVKVLEVEGASSFVTLSWDYNADGETVKWVELEFEFGFGNYWQGSSVLVARKPVNQALQIFQARDHGRITFSERATFTLSNITRNDTGRFTCRVSFNTSHPEIYNSTKLVMVVKPTVIIRPPSPVELNESDSTTLVCEASGFPYLSLITFKKGRFTNNKVYRGRWGIRRHSVPINIYAASKADAGRYTCAAEVFSPGLLTPISANYTIDVRVRFKPQVTLGNDTVDEGSDAFLYCNATAYPTPDTYSWFKNGKQITSDPNGDFVIEDFGDGQSRLTVKHVKHYKNGGYSYVYRCSAANVMGTGESKLAFLRVNYPPQNVRVTGPSLAVVSLGQRIILFCSADGYPYPTSYYWKFNGNVISGDTWSSLRLSNVKVNEAGNYTCGARNRLGFKESAIKMVVVEHQPTLTDFNAGTPYNSVLQGTTATLSCSADGYPAPTYTIRYGTKIVTQQSKTGKYVINNIQLDAEEQSYFCVPSNKFGVGPKKELAITVQVLPRFPGQTLPTKQIKEENQIVTYSCTAEAKPAAKFLWMLNGQSLPNISPYSMSASVLPIPRSKLSRTIGYLIINKVTWRQSGQFSCIAINDVGNATQTTELEVSSAPTESGKVNGQKDNQQNESAELSSSQMSGVIVGILILLVIILALFAYIVRLKRQGIKRTERSGMENGENIPDRCAFVNKELEMAHGTSDVTPERDEVKA